MTLRKARLSLNDAGHGATSALDALLVAESEAERAIQQADAEAVRLLSDARDRAAKMERDAADALAADLDRRAAENAAKLEEQTKAVTSAADRRISHLRGLGDDDVQKLAEIVVSRLTERPR